MLELNKIYNEDCIIGMQKIEDNSIDLMLTDPPYNISMPSGLESMGRSGLDFGEWDKDFDQKEWLSIACDKIKKGGSVIIFNDWKNIGIMKEVLESKGFTLKELIQWKKTNPMPRNRDRLYVTSCEFAIWAVKGSGWTFNRLRDTYEDTVFTYPIVPDSQRIHPTQKRDEVISDLLRIHSNVGDRILEPFSGSGVTAKCCIEEGRDFVAFEKDPIMWGKSVDRISVFLW